jgi:glutamyl-tRNA synthetase
MISAFSLDAIGQSASAFNTDKLIWLNQHYIKTLPASEVAKHAKWYFEQLGIDTSVGPTLEDVITIQADRVKNLKELAEISQYFYQDYDQFDEKAAKKHLRPVAKDALLKIKEKLVGVASWEPTLIQQAINQSAEELGVGMGKIGMPLRVAVTGAGNSPSLDVTLHLLNCEQVAQRIDKALIYIANRENS